MTIFFSAPQQRLFRGGQRGRKYNEVYFGYYKNYTDIVLQNNEVYAPLTKKELRGNSHKINNVPPRIYKNVDLDYVYIEFEQEFHKWEQGAHIVTKVK